MIKVSEVKGREMKVKDHNLICGSRMKSKS